MISCVTETNGHKPYAKQISVLYYTNTNVDYLKLDFAYLFPLA